MRDGDTLTLLRSRKPLAKIWTADGTVIPSARSSWFEYLELQVFSVDDVLKIVQYIQFKRRVAIVKEAIAPGANPRRLRRTCRDGVDKFQKPFKAGLTEVPRRWVVLDIENLPRPPHIEFHDGDMLAEYVRTLLPPIFSNARCVWQLSGRSGHPSHRDEVRLHLYFFLDKMFDADYWKKYFRGIKFIDLSIYDKSKLIFTAAPIINYGLDPIDRRVGMLDGEPIVSVPELIVEGNPYRGKIALHHRLQANASAVAPMIAEANAFIDIVSRSNVLRTQHVSYDGNRSRRLAFCSLLRSNFGVIDEAFLMSAFYNTCIGEGDQHQCRDASEALVWARNPSFTGRSFSAHKLLCDASRALRASGDEAAARIAARMAVALDLTRQPLPSEDL